jgi:hypothetical protein
MNDVEDMNKRLQKYDDFTTGDYSRCPHPTRELSANIVDLFEDFLEKKGIVIKNDERPKKFYCTDCNYETDDGLLKCLDCGSIKIIENPDYSEAGILYGSDYYDLEDEITEMIVNTLKGD